MNRFESMISLTFARISASIGASGADVLKSGTAMPSRLVDLVEGDRLSSLRLFEPKPSALIRAGDAVQQLDDSSRVRIRVVKRAREQ